MNHKIKTLGPIALVFTLLLTGCATQTVTPTGTTSEQAGTPENIESSRMDKKVSCDMLKSASGKKECETQVNEIIAQQLRSEIISSFDLGRCATLPTALASQCESSIKETGVTGPVSEEELAKFKEALSPSFEQIAPGTEETTNQLPPKPAYDKTKCTQLKTAGYQAYCEKQIQNLLDRQEMMTAIETKDIKKCDTLSGDEQKRECKMFFGEDEDIIEILAPPVPADTKTSPDGIAPADNI